MTGIVITASAVLLVLFGLLCIVTADAIRAYRANRKTEAASLSKRQHEAAVAQFANILREALLQRGKK